MSDGKEIMTETPQQGKIPCEAPCYIFNKLKPVTCWLRFNVQKSRFEHNHIESGHVYGKTPKGDAKQTKAWSNSTWMFEHKHLDDNQRVI